MKNFKNLLSLPYLIWMIGFIILPLFIVVYYGFTTKDGSITIENVLTIFNQIHIKALRLSLLLSFISTVICLILAYPLAMILHSLNIKSSGFMIVIFILPMWMNFLLRTLAWQTLLDKSGVINGVLEALNLPKLNIINTPGAIVFGMVYNFLPFMVLPIYNILAKIDDSVIDAAKDLGAKSIQIFIKIIFPLSFPGVISGITMVFVPALTTFVISDILGGSKILLIGNIIEQEFKIANNWNVGSGLSLVLMVFILISMALLNKYDKEGTSLW